MFQANAIQFGLDQLLEAPTTKLEAPTSKPSSTGTTGVRMLAGSDTVLHMPQLAWQQTMRLVIQQ